MSDLDISTIVDAVILNADLQVTADLAALIGLAAGAALEAVERGGTPSIDAVEQTIAAGVRAAMGALPVGLPKSTKNAIADGLAAALTWAWREAQPAAVIVTAGASDLEVEIDDEPEPLPPDPDPDPEP